MIIGGFKITKKVALVLGGIIFLIVIIAIGNSASKKREAEERYRAEQERLAALQAQNAANSSQQSLTYDEQVQQQLIAQYGLPPEGFRWTLTGELEALGDESSVEDVLFIYLRSLSMLDFSTAQRYSSTSSVISKYEDYYSAGSTAYANYYSNFLRKQYALSIQSLELNSVSSTAVMADGTTYATLKISALDLTDKDFWESDRDDMFDDMYVIQRTESDSTKLRSYVYDYMLDAYEQGKIGKKEYTVEIVLYKNAGGGWLVGNDSELEAILHYEQGVDVAMYIQTEFQEYSIDRTNKEINRG